MGVLGSLPPKLSALIWLLTLTVAAFGQQYHSQQGHLLDANPRLGSFGWNSNARLDALMPRANLYVTGNVTGGARFQGLVPYGSVDEFSQTLGTSALSSFRRDSVGLGDLRGGPSGGPRPYIDVSRSVTSTYGGAVVQMHRVYQPAVTPMGASLRTPSLYADRLALRSPGEPFSGNLNLPPAWTEVDQDAEFLQNAPAAFPRSGAIGQQALPIEPYSPPDLLQIQRGRQLQTQQERTAESFAQELELIPKEEQAEQQQADEAEAAEYPPPPTQPESPPPADLPGPPTAGADGSPATPLQQDAAASFSAAAQKQFVFYMRQGNELLRRGQYYRAAGSFGSAVVFRPYDPNAYVAKTHAHFAAGEFMSAALSLNQALLLSADWLKQRIDVQALFPDAQEFQHRLDDLNRWQQQSNRPTLLFLQGYIFFQIGRFDQAQTALDAAWNAQLQTEGIKRLRDALDDARQKPLENDDSLGADKK